MRNLINKFLSFGKPTHRADEQPQSLPAKETSATSTDAYVATGIRQEENVKGLNEQAFDLLQQGLHAEAKAHLLKSLAINSRNEDAHYMLGQIAQSSGESNDAESHYRQAVSIQADFEPAYIAWCSVLIGAGRFAEAKDVAARGISHVPKHVQSLELHFYLGNLYFQEGRFAEAVQCFEQALGRQPGNRDLIANLVLALQNLGVLHQQQNDYALASQYFRKALENDPINAETLFMLAHARQLQGDEAAAISLYIASLTSDPSQVKTMSNLGLLLSQQGKSPDAIKWMMRATLCAPQDATLFNNLANLLQASGQNASAIAAFKTAIAADPNLAQSYFGLGVALQAANQIDEAASAYQTALQLDPGLVEAHCNLGRILQAEDSLEEALIHYRRATATQPEFHIARVNAADVLEHLGRFDEAIAECDAVLSVNARDTDALLNKALILIAVGKFGEAIACYDRVLQIDPADERAYAYKANALLNACKLDEAIQCCDALLAFKPEHAEAHFVKASALLCGGNYANGWREYEYRWQLGTMPVVLTGNTPVWTGEEDLSNKSILVIAEQGLGDSLEFVRYTSLLAAHNATVHVLAPKPLVSLIASCKGVTAVHTSREQVGHVDYQIAMMSLPLACKTILATVPATCPYLFPQESLVATWATRLASSTGLRIGLVWSGHAHKNQRGVHRAFKMRSCTLDQLTPLLDLAGVDFYSLQLGEEASAQIQGNPRIIDLTSHITDFADTAALMMHLDLIISVDTSVAHLAGALGKPIWLLNRHNTCWRWLLEREDSPWYPSARIFRQPRPGDWASVISEVKNALDDLLVAQ
jgi:tetratricopeptide (TPR) repeat protein